ncbi:hypothetical protein ANSO36C_33750 [Nostoc cf. commune SO-36]|uniref:Response regulatory domain-containing protein n=1 Tax=Nostoc cf. commune SO-36 TaxID=449208 RepID=A0ABM7Z3I3_NOSCO|nr:hypothetical protein ANSO36C_33750 [Nostoc cf. commune SO-36]
METCDRIHQAENNLREKVAFYCWVVLIALSAIPPSPPIKLLLRAKAAIVLTASVLEEEKAIVFSVGCNDFLRKPFAENTIFNTRAKYLGVKNIFAENNS